MNLGVWALKTFLFPKDMLAKHHEAMSTLAELSAGIILKSGPCKKWLAEGLAFSGQGVS